MFTFSAVGDLEEKLIIECDGPWHFLQVAQASGDGTVFRKSQITAKTQLRNNMLAKAGYGLATVSQTRDADAVVEQLVELWKAA